MQHFYDGQIRRYVTQLVRLVSNISYKDGKGALTQIPVVYGDLTRQVGSIIRDNSENKIPSAPRMAVYMTELELDTARLADASYISKVNVREKDYDDGTQLYLNKQGKNYTVERLMPTPYQLSVNVDIWSTNTEQKLQILEQVLVLFNPSLEIQTTDNYIDWTSLTVVNLEGINFTSRSIPMGTESEIDVATLTLKTPIYISPPAKVKRLGVITNIITNIFNETIQLVDTDYGMAEVRQVLTSEDGTTTTTKKITYPNTIGTLGTNYNDFDLLVMGNTAQLVNNGVAGETTWTSWFEAVPQKYIAGVTQIQLRRKDINTVVSGTVAIDTTDERRLIINWDSDTFPADTIIHGPTGDNNKINYIIDPQKSNPESLKTAGVRILLLDAIGDSSNTDGADAWKNADNSNFIAGANDIIEWDGSKWHVVFDSSTDDSSANIVYTTNLNTGVQYKFDNDEWILSFEGEYPNGSWLFQY
jgi:hypothetical protein|tara:strand:+ start:32061 stop:33479 length:1419 start_codon:yes stop_codon:yes gene_type:complete